MELLIHWTFQKRLYIDLMFVSVHRLMLRSSQNLKEQEITVTLTHMTRNHYISRPQKNVQKNLSTSNIGRIRRLIRFSARDWRIPCVSTEGYMFRVFSAKDSNSWSDDCRCLWIIYYRCKCLFIDGRFSWFLFCRGFIRTVGFVAVDAWLKVPGDKYFLNCLWKCCCWVWVFFHQPSQVVVPFEFFLSIVCWNAQTQEW